MQRYFVPEPLPTPPPLLPPVLGAGTGFGLVVALPEPLPDMLPVVLPLVEPLPVAPAPARSSRRHFSRSAPIRLAHFAGTSVLAPVLAEPDGVPVVPDELPDAPAPTLEPDVPLAPVLPDVEPDDCANATDDSARRAAAVAAVIVFIIMVRISWRG